ncbi:response regulator [Deinococcus roseus]|nr:response regulator [Deinococcus roseus]
MPENRGPRVLLVEDSAVQQQVMSIYLRSHGYTLQIAGSLLEAQQKLNAVDILVLDLILPDGSGLNSSSMSAVRHSP